MQHAASCAFSPWALFRKCAKHAVLIKPALLSQHHVGNFGTRSVLPRLHATYISDAERTLHTQLQKMVRNYTTESPASADSAVAEPGGTAESSTRSQISKSSLNKANVATVLDDSQHALTAKDIPSYAWPVLLDLKLAGHDTFIVGGTVRDLILGRTPKDVDVLTSASLQQVRRLTRRCQIVGKRFPIALVHAPGGNTIEVSCLTSLVGPSDAAGIAHLASKHSLRPETLSRSWTSVWQQNMLKRDFTVNALMYDPFSHLLYDYVGGLTDCAKKRLQCCQDPQIAFTEDIARMLRAVRVCSRTDLTMSKGMEAVMRHLAPQLATLNGSRLQLELVNIFSHGNALKTLHLLWRVHLLDVMMPPVALYLHKHKLKRNAVVQTDDKQRVPLLQLLHLMDQHSSIRKPASMPLLHAVLASSLLADIIATHSQQLQNLLAETNANSKTQKSRPKSAKSAHKAARHQSQAYTAPVADSAVNKWHQRLQLQPELRLEIGAWPKLLFDCLVTASVDHLQSQMLSGMMVNAHRAIIEKLLKGTWQGTSLHHQTQSTEQNKLKNARRKFEGYRATPQDLLNEVLLKAGVHWHELLEVPLDIAL